MNTTKYEVFARAARLGSLSKAAEEMGYTQSGISHMMRSLEQEVGFALFARSAGGVRLSEEGKTLLPLVQEVLNRSEYLEQTIASINGLERGNIRIAAFSSVAINWLPAILREFERHHPSIRVEVNEGGVDVIEGMLEKGLADLAIYARTANAGFDWVPLREDPLYAVLPLQHPLAGQTVFPIEAFLENDFIAPSRDFDYDIHRVLDNLERYPKNKFTSRNDYAIIAMVANGLGLSILPELILRNNADKVCALPMDPPFHRSLGIGVPRLKDAPPAVVQFIRQVRRMVGAKSTVLLP